MIRHLTNDFVQNLGFNSVSDFHRMIAKVDLASPSKLQEFREWQHKDGTKKGLTRLVVENETIPQTFDDAFKRLYADLPQKLEVLAAYLNHIEIPDQILQMRDQIKKNLMKATADFPYMVKFYQLILNVFDSELSVRGFKV